MIIGLTNQWSSNKKMGRLRNKLILITGGAGFIGSNLVDTLLKEQARIICLDNFIKRENIEEAQKNRNFLLYKTDIRNKQEIESVFKNHSPIDCLIHLAAKAGVRESLKNPTEYNQINVYGTKNILESSKKFLPKQLIFASSSSVYGNCQTPFSENEKNLKPISPYGQTKLKAEELCFYFYQRTHIPTTILRFFSVYGPRGRPDMAPYLFTKALFNNRVIKQYGDGLTARDWTYISDIICGIKKSIGRPFNFEIINLGGNKPVKLLELLNLIEKIIGKKFRKIILPKCLEEPDITFANIKKAKKLLGWEPLVEFSQGMKNFIKWYKKNRLKSS